MNLVQDAAAPDASADDRDIQMTAASGVGGNFPPDLQGDELPPDAFLNPPVLPPPANANVNANANANANVNPRAPILNGEGQIAPIEFELELVNPPAAGGNQVPRLFTAAMDFFCNRVIPLSAEAIGVGGVTASITFLIWYLVDSDAFTTNILESIGHDLPQPATAIPDGSVLTSMDADTPPSLRVLLTAHGDGGPAVTPGRVEIPVIQKIVQEWLAHGAAQEIESESLALIGVHSGDGIG